VCVCVCVCRMVLAAAAAGGRGDVILAGLVLRQGYILEHHTNLTQNSHFKQCILWWLGDLQPHPIYCITVPLVDMKCRVCVCVIYTFIYRIHTLLYSIFIYDAINM